jgi:hypothetical protein
MGARPYGLGLKLTFAFAIHGGKLPGPQAESPFLPPLPAA